MPPKRWRSTAVKNRSAVKCVTRFRSVVSNYKHFVNKTMVFTGWNLSMSHIIIPLPWMLQAPRMFTGQIQLGAVIQSVAAFGAIQDALSFFRNSYDVFAGYRASIIRLHGLVMANEQSRELPKLNIETSPAVVFDDIEVRNPAGDQLIDALNLQLNPGDAMIITGESGTGKSTLLRSLAQLWPYTSGTMGCPIGEHETMFLSQLPYVPLGDLRAVVSYPSQPGEFPTRRCRPPCWRSRCRSTPTGSARSRTGPRCSPPESNSASRSPESC